MALFINIRATNGGGKTTLLRNLVKASDAYRVEPTIRQTKEDGTPRGKPFPVTLLSGGIAIMGDYSPEAADKTTAGCDRISTQLDMRRILKHIATIPGVRVVLFEGIIVSTLFQSWLEWSREVKAEGHDFLWAFIDTPLHVCLERIQQRNGGKPVKTDQVASKFRSIDRILHKARVAGERVAALNYLQALEELKEWIQC